MAFLGIPTAGEAQARQDAYEQQRLAQGSQYARARAQATSRIAQSVTSAMGTTGNPNIGGRLAAHEAGRVQGDLANAEAAAAQQLRAQQLAQEQAVHQQEMATQRQVFGGLIGGAGQVLGMAVPAFGALGGGGVASALGGAAAGTPNQPAGLGMLGQAVLGGGAPAPQVPAQPLQQASLGSAGPLGPQQTPQFASPMGQAETFEERMRRLQLGGGFIGSPMIGGGLR